MRLISSARISAIVKLLAAKRFDRSGLEVLAHPLELRAQTAVQHGGAYLRHQAADQGGIGFRLEHDRAAGHPADRLAEPADLVLAQRPRRGHGGADPPGLLV